MHDLRFSMCTKTVVKVSCDSIGLCVFVVLSFGCTVEESFTSYFSTTTSQATQSLVCCVCFVYIFLFHISRKYCTVYEYSGALIKDSLQSNILIMAGFTEEHTHTAIVYRNH